MRNLTRAFASTLLVLGAMTMTASAQAPLLGAPGVGAQIKNATPIIHNASCFGTTGVYGCGPGFTWACNRWGRHCRCVRC